MATPAGLQSPTAGTVGAEEEPQHFEVFCVPQGPRRPTAGAVGAEKEPQHFEVFCVPQGSRQSYTYVSLRLIFYTIKSFFHTN